MLRSKMPLEKRFRKTYLNLQPFFGLFRAWQKLIFKVRVYLR